MGRILGLDYGSKRIGIALSDPLKRIAQPFGAFSAVPEADVLEKIASLIREQDVETVVVGFPLTLRGGKSRFTERVELFAGELAKAISVPVAFWDERLSSQQAQRILHQMGRKPSREKAAVDVLSAVLVLQQYLDCLTERIHSS